MQMLHLFFIHSLVERQLGCFQVLAIMISATRNTVEQMSLWYECTSFGYMSQTIIAGYWNTLIPNVLRNHHTHFQSDCTNLRSHQQWRSVPLFSHPLQHKLSLVFLILAFLTGIRRHFRIILICISLTTNDVEQFLNCPSAICYSFVENSLFRSVTHFLIALFGHSVLYILEISPLLMWS